MDWLIAASGFIGRDSVRASFYQKMLSVAELRLKHLLVSFPIRIMAVWDRRACLRQRQEEEEIPKYANDLLTADQKWIGVDFDRLRLVMKRVPRQYSGTSCGAHALVRAHLLLAHFRLDHSHIVEFLSRYAAIDFFGLSPFALASFSLYADKIDRCTGDLTVQQLRHELDCARPVVALIAVPDSLLDHYVCIVGYAGEEFLVLDTDNGLDVWSSTTLEELCQPVIGRQFIVFGRY